MKQKKQSFCWKIQEEIYVLEETGDRMVCGEIKVEDEVGERK